MLSRSDRPDSAPSVQLRSEPSVHFLNEAFMVLNFDELNKGASQKQTDPRKLFTTLDRHARFKRPLDEQSDVLDSWFLKRERQDTTIKMNTGAGKTLVGLLALQSSINEGIFPAVFVTPDNYLVSQVVKEAKRGVLDRPGPATPRLRRGFRLGSP